MNKEILNRVIKGAIQREDRANVANPWLKLSLVVLPLFVGTCQLIMRLNGNPIADEGAIAIITILIGVLLAQSIDFRRKNMGRMLRWALTCILLEIVVFLLMTETIHLDEIRKSIKWIPAFAPIGFVGGYVTMNDAILFACFLVSARGWRLINAIDAFSLCSTFSWVPKLKVLYETCIVTYFTIAHSLSALFSQAGMTARNRYRLLRVQSGWFEAYQSASKIYIKVLLEGFSERAELTESILEERQWYSRLATKTTPPWNAEDSLAVIILVLFCSLSWIGFRV